MAYEPDRPFAEDGDMISIKQNLEEYGYTIAASLDSEKHKIGALSEEKLKEKIDEMVETAINTVEKVWC